MLEDGFDANHPEILVFQDDEPDSRVIAIAYNVLGSLEEGPPTDLPLELIGWHLHTNICERDGVFIGSEDFPCAENGGTLRPDLDNWMVDLWIIPGWENPWGLISSKHPDLYNLPWFGENS